MTGTTLSYFHPYFQGLIEFYHSELKLGLVFQLENLHACFQHFPASLMIQKELVQRKHQWSEYTQELNVFIRALGVKTSLASHSGSHR